MQQISDEEVRDLARLVAALREIPAERRLTALALAAKVVIERSEVLDGGTHAAD